MQLNMNMFIDALKNKQEIFSRLERVASQANLSEEERARYEEEWKIYNDYFNTIESAKKQGTEEGMEKGRAEGKHKANIENAKKMKAMEFPIETISQITGLSPEEIEKL